MKHTLLVATIETQKRNLNVIEVKMRRERKNKNNSNTESKRVDADRKAGEISLNGSQHNLWDAKQISA